MSCEIIQFSAAARPARKALDKSTAAKVIASYDCEERRPLAPPLTEPAKTPASGLRVAAPGGMRAGW